MSAAPWTCARSGQGGPADRVVPLFAGDLSCSPRWMRTTAASARWVLTAIRQSDNTPAGNHPGAARAAAAMGLSLGQGSAGDSGAGMDVSYFRKEAERKFQERQAFLKSNAPPPTVGLIKVCKSASLPYASASLASSRVIRHSQGRA
jgi:hypothetical protein